MYRRNLGDQFRDIVDAVDSYNFSDLNNKIKNTADRAIDEFNRATESFQYDNRGNHGPNRYRNRNEVPPFMGGGANNFGQMSGNWNARPSYQKKRRRPGVPNRTSSILFNVFGTIGTIFFGISAIAAFGVSRLALFTAWNFILPTLGTIFVIAGAASAGILALGIKQTKRIRRYNQYDEIVGPNTYCEIKRLAEQSGRTEKYVIKDLERMIQLGFFSEGHIDEGKTCFMVNDQTYHQYLEALNNYKEREQQEAKKKQEEEGQDPELRKTIESGNAYIKQINSANKDIPGEEISRKLYQLEDIVGKIFICVQKHPNKLPEIRKFMEYYLPITLKLVNAYKEFDAQPIQGENIKKSKKEIEDTIDTINTAFEKLLDSLYEDEAMEVASDISVLNTLFAQEGLTKKDFDLK